MPMSLSSPRKSDNLLGETRRLAPRPCLGPSRSLRKTSLRTSCTGQPSRSLPSSWPTSRLSLACWGQPALCSIGTWHLSCVGLEQWTTETKVAVEGVDDRQNSSRRGCSSMPPSVQYSTATTYLGPDGPRSAGLSSALVSLGSHSRPSSLWTANSDPGRGMPALEHAGA